jgi:hypothetical protein
MHLLPFNPRAAELNRAELRQVRRTAWRLVSNLREPQRRAAYERCRDAIEREIVSMRLAAMLAGAGSLTKETPCQQSR